MTPPRLHRPTGTRERALPAHHHRRCPYTDKTIRLPANQSSGVELQWIPHQPETAPCRTAPISIRSGPTLEAIIREFAVFSLETLRRRGLRAVPMRPSPCNIVLVAAATVCPHCDTNESVRVESIVEGRRVHYMCYCSRCEYVWEVYRAVSDGIQRRRFSRRRLAARRRNTLLRGPRDRRRRS
jgi:hypothetical protein